MTTAITEAAAVIRRYNPALAAAFLSQPFRRVLLAQAFIRGFMKTEEDEAPAFAWMILRVAMLEVEKMKKIPEAA